MNPRRQFLRDSLLVAGGLALGLPRSAKAATASIDVLVNEPIATINPNIYGHFIEHLGAVVYDGIWVGEKSPVANYDGIRKQLVDRGRRDGQAGKPVLRVSLTRSCSPTCRLARS